MISVLFKIKVSHAVVGCSAIQQTPPWRFLLFACSLHLEHQGRAISFLLVRHFKESTLLSFFADLFYSQWGNWTEDNILTSLFHIFVNALWENKCLLNTLLVNLDSGALAVARLGAKQPLLQRFGICQHFLKVLNDLSASECISLALLDLKASFKALCMGFFFWQPNSVVWYLWSSLLIFSVGMLSSFNASGY